MKKYRLKSIISSVSKRLKKCQLNLVNSLDLKRQGRVSYSFEKAKKSQLNLIITLVIKRKRGVN